MPRIRRIQSVLDQTAVRYLDDIRREDFERKYPYVDPSLAANQGSPTIWYQSGYTSARDVKVKLYPVPNSVRTLQMFWYEEPLALVNDGDIPRIPDQWHYGLVYLGLAKYYEFQREFISIYYRNLHEAYKTKVLTTEYGDSTEMPQIEPVSLHDRFIVGKIGRVYN